MRILLDECLDRRLAPLITGHEVTTVPQQGWAGKKNGELLQLASANFDAFITIDSNLSSQQNLESLELAIIVLLAPTNRLADIEPLILKILSALETAKPGCATVVSQDTP